jgi:hypothetical protein
METRCKKLLCKKCHKNERVTLYFCEECKQIHNQRTRELKQRYRREGRCTNCGAITSYYKCLECQNKDIEGRKNSKFRQSQKSKIGVYGNEKQLLKII